MAEANKPGLLAKAHKRISRTKTKVLQTLGKAGKYTDETFDDLVQKTEKQHDVAHHLQKEIKSYVHCMRALSNASKSLSAAIGSTYEEEWTDELAFKKSLESQELLWTDYMDSIQNSVMEPMNTYLASFPAIKAKIAKRGRKMVDFDNSRHNLEVLQAAKKKDESKIAKATEDLNESKRIFEDLHNELCTELPEFYNSRITLYADLFQKLFGCEHTLHAEFARISDSLGNTAEALSKDHVQFVYTPKRLSASQQFDNCDEHAVNGECADSPTTPTAVPRPTLNTNVVTRPTSRDSSSSAGATGAVGGAAGDGHVEDTDHMYGNQAAISATAKVNGDTEIPSEIGQQQEENNTQAAATAQDSPVAERSATVTPTLADDSCAVRPNDKTSLFAGDSAPASISAVPACSNHLSSLSHYLHPPLPLPLSAPPPVVSQGCPSLTQSLVEGRLFPLGCKDVSGLDVDYEVATGHARRPNGPSGQTEEGSGLAECPPVRERVTSSQTAKVTESLRAYSSSNSDIFIDKCYQQEVDTALREDCAARQPLEVHQSHISSPVLTIMSDLATDCVQKAGLEEVLLMEIQKCDVNRQDVIAAPTDSNSALVTEQQHSPETKSVSVSTSDFETLTERSGDCSSSSGKVQGSQRGQDDDGGPVLDRTNCGGDDVYGGSKTAGQGAVEVVSCVRNTEALDDDDDGVYETIFPQSATATTAGVGVTRHADCSHIVEVCLEEASVTASCEELMTPLAIERTIVSETDDQTLQTGSPSLPVSSMACEKEDQRMCQSLCEMVSVQGGVHVGNRNAQKKGKDVLAPAGLAVENGNGYLISPTTSSHSSDGSGHRDGESSNRTDMNVTEEPPPIPCRNPIIDVNCGHQERELDVVRTDISVTEERPPVPPRDPITGVKSGHGESEMGVVRADFNMAEVPPRDPMSGMKTNMTEEAPRDPVTGVMFKLPVFLVGPNRMVAGQTETDRRGSLGKEDSKKGFGHRGLEMVRSMFHMSSRTKSGEEKGWTKSTKSVEFISPEKSWPQPEDVKKRKRSSPEKSPSTQTKVSKRKLSAPSPSESPKLGRVTKGPLTKTGVRDGNRKGGGGFDHSISQSKLGGSGGSAVMNSQYGTMCSGSSGRGQQFSPAGNVFKTQGTKDASIKDKGETPSFQRMNSLNQHDGHVLNGNQKRPDVHHTSLPTRDAGTLHPGQDSAVFSSSAAALLSMGPDWSVTGQQAPIAKLPSSEPGRPPSRPAGKTLNPLAPPFTMPSSKGQRPVSAPTSNPRLPLNSAVSGVRSELFGQQGSETVQAKRMLTFTQAEPKGEKKQDSPAMFYHKGLANHTKMGTSEECLQSVCPSTAASTGSQSSSLIKVLRQALHGRRAQASMQHAPKPAFLGAQLVQQRTLPAAGPVYLQRPCWGLRTEIEQRGFEHGGDVAMGTQPVLPGVLQKKLLKEELETGTLPHKMSSQVDKVSKTGEGDVVRQVPSHSGTTGQMLKLTELAKLHNISTELKKGDAQEEAVCIKARESSFTIDTTNSKSLDQARQAWRTAWRTSSVIDKAPSEGSVLMKETSALKTSSSVVQPPHQPTPPPLGNSVPQDACPDVQRNLKPQPLHYKSTAQAVAMTEASRDYQMVILKRKLAKDGYIPMGGSVGDRPRGQGCVKNSSGYEDMQRLWKNMSLEEQAVATGCPGQSQNDEVDCPAVTEVVQDSDTVPVPPVIPQTVQKTVMGASSQIGDSTEDFSYSRPAVVSEPTIRGSGEEAHQKLETEDCSLLESVGSEGIGLRDTPGLLMEGRPSPQEHADMFKLSVACQIDLEEFRGNSQQLSGGTEDTTDVGLQAGDHSPCSATLEKAEKLAEIANMPATLKETDVEQNSFAQARITNISNKIHIKWYGIENRDADNIPESGRKLERLVSDRQCQWNSDIAHNTEDNEGSHEVCIGAVTHFRISSNESGDCVPSCHTPCGTTRDYFQTEIQPIEDQERLGASGSLTDCDTPQRTTEWEEQQEKNSVFAAELCESQYNHQDCKHLAGCGDSVKAEQVPGNCDEGIIQHDDSLDSSSPTLPEVIQNTAHSVCSQTATPRQDRDSQQDTGNHSTPLNESIHINFPHEKDCTSSRHSVASEMDYPTEGHSGGVAHFEDRVDPVCDGIDSVGSVDVATIGQQDPDRLGSVDGMKTVVGPEPTVTLLHNQLVSDDEQTLSQGCFDTEMSCAPVDTLHNFPATDVDRSVDKQSTEDCNHDGACAPCIVGQSDCMVDVMHTSGCHTSQHSSLTMGQNSLIQQENHTTSLAMSQNSLIQQENHTTDVRSCDSTISSHWDAEHSSSSDTMLAVNVITGRASSEVLLACDSGISTSGFTHSLTNVLEEDGTVVTMLSTSDLSSPLSHHHQPLSSDCNLCCDTHLTLDREHWLESRDEQRGTSRLVDEEARREGTILGKGQSLDVDEVGCSGTEYSLAVELQESLTLQQEVLTPAQGIITDSMEPGHEELGDDERTECGEVDSMEPIYVEHGDDERTECGEVDSMEPIYVEHGEDERTECGEVDSMEPIYVEHGDDERKECGEVDSMEPIYVEHGDDERTECGEVDSMEPVYVEHGDDERKECGVGYSREPIDEGEHGDSTEHIVVEHGDDESRRKECGDGSHTHSEPVHVSDCRESPSEGNSDCHMASKMTGAENSKVLLTGTESVEHFTQHIIQTCAQPLHSFEAYLREAVEMIASPEDGSSSILEITEVSGSMLSPEKSHNAIITWEGPREAKKQSSAPTVEAVIMSVDNVTMSPPDNGKDTETVDCKESESNNEFGAESPERDTMLNEMKGGNTIRPHDTQHEQTVGHDGCLILQATVSLPSYNSSHDRDTNEDHSQKTATISPSPWEDSTVRKLYKGQSAAGTDREEKDRVLPCPGDIQTVESQGLCEAGSSHFSRCRDIEKGHACLEAAIGCEGPHIDQGLSVLDGHCNDQEGGSAEVVITADNEGHDAVTGLQSSGDHQPERDGERWERDIDSSAWDVALVQSQPPMGEMLPDEIPSPSVGSRASQEVVGSCNCREGCVQQTENRALVDKTCSEPVQVCETSDQYDSEGFEVLTSHREDEVYDETEGIPTALGNTTAVRCHRETTEGDCVMLEMSALEMNALSGEGGTTKTEGQTVVVNNVYEAPDGNEDEDSGDEDGVYQTPPSNKPVYEPPPSTLYQVEATHAYTGEDIDELSFDPGDIIYVVSFDNEEEQDDGWQMGIKQKDGLKGVFPENFTKRL